MFHVDKAPSAASCLFRIARIQGQASILGCCICMHARLEEMSPVCLLKRFTLDYMAPAAFAATAQVKVLLLLCFAVVVLRRCFGSSNVCVCSMELPLAPRRRCKNKTGICVGVLYYVKESRVFNVSAVGRKLSDDERIHGWTGQTSGQLQLLLSTRTLRAGACSVACASKHARSENYRACLFYSAAPTAAAAVDSPRGQTSSSCMRIPHTAMCMSRGLCGRHQQHRRAHSNYGVTVAVGAYCCCRFSCESFLYPAAPATPALASPLL